MSPMLSSHLSRARSLRRPRPPALRRAPLGLLLAVVAAAGPSGAPGAATAAAPPEPASAPPVAGSFDLRDRGSTDLAYDPLRDALSFRLVYRQPPTDRNRFYQEIDRLVATQLRWSEGRFLEQDRPSPD